MRAVIRAEGLGKQYRIGTRERYGSLRDSIARVAATPGWLFRRPESDTHHKARTIWALRDASFEVGDGEILGIIGRNGSGKSTLLKILSRITEPSEGHVDITGRVGSLLEVGTGFHPELTGRENVFVNGAILGMRRREIAAKFNEIVAFSGVEKFIDTPVKHYSSGMQMRLAFAVAAHLQPNILLVDEVLAVGDAEFQRRCLSKMQDVSLEGRTVILVSHQMNQIRRLCRTAMWLDAGRIQCVGPVGETIRRYEYALTSGGDAAGAGTCFIRWELSTGGHTLTNTDRPFAIRVHLQLRDAVVGGHYGVALLDDNDKVVAGWAFEPISLASGRHVLDARVPQLPLRPGSYHINLGLFTGGNNLTGGTLVEKWMATPPLTLDVQPLTHPQDAWAGILNVPATLERASASEPMPVSGSAPLAVQSVQ
jgi:homopolymeric O-antigen transport system ATP-binding protein